MLNKEFLIFLTFTVLLSPILHSFSYDIDSAKLIFYYGPTADDHQSYDFSNAASIPSHPKFNIQLPTNCFFCGYNVSQKDLSTRLIINSYLKNKDINLLTIDWTTLNRGSFTEDQEILLKLGPKIGDALIELFDAGVDKERFILVAHSIGAAGAGIVGRYIQTKSKNHTLSRISGLDPLNPGRTNGSFFIKQLQKTDASFVDIIHTDAGDFGTTSALGDADFWPNDGTAVQPGCPSEKINENCSHLKSIAYWAESVEKKSDRDLFLATGGHPSPVQMGYNCPTDATGNYTLKIESYYGEIPEFGLIVG